MKDVVRPQRGETADEAEVITWLKDVGDEVARGDALLEVQTDKITVEIPALDSGVLREVLVQAGDVVMVGAKIARLEPASSSTSSADNSDNSPTHQASQATQVEASSPTRQTFTAEPVPATPNKLRASPSARRVARELGVTLADVTGTGPRGRITSDDVRAASKLPETTQESVSEQVAEPVTSVQYPDTSFHAPDNLADTFTDIDTNRYHLP